ncbi:MAG: alkylhydroperoxidase [Pseudomonadota bacterium]
MTEEVPKPSAPCWIETVAPEAAQGQLAELYGELTAIHGRVHNLYRACSLRPGPVRWADLHYRAVLHDPENALEDWFLELLSTQVALLADCGYALANHGENFLRLMDDRPRGLAMLAALRRHDLACDLFTPKHAALLQFGEKLALRPQDMTRADLDPLRAAGVRDVEILEAVQATACFAYWVRLINGLGINLGDEKIGRQL